MTTSLVPEAMSEQAVEDLVKSIGIPARPSLLSDVQLEMSKDDPDPRTIAKLVSQDVAMSAALLKSANSVFFGLKRKAETVEQAASFLGLTQTTSILLGLISRKAINAEGHMLTRFWDVSTKRSLAMARLAKEMRLCAPDVAHTFGLFCDIGIPLLMTRFPDYAQTLALANNEDEQPFTRIEEVRHSINHAIIGAIMSRSWGLSANLTHAIRVHHDYEVMVEKATPPEVSSLIAMCVLSERAIQSYQNLNRHAEWDKGGMLAREVLGISEDEVIDYCEDLHAIFNDA